MHTVATWHLMAFIEGQHDCHKGGKTYLRWNLLEFTVNILYFVLTKHMRHRHHCETVKKLQYALNPHFGPEITHFNCARDEYKVQ